MTKAEIKARVEKTKSYIKSHIPHVVTACASVVGVAIMSKQLGETKKVRLLAEDQRNAFAHNAAVAQSALEAGREFDIYPGVGVYIHPAKEDRPKD